MVPQEFLGIGWGELMLLLVLAVIFFGPEKLPEISRKAARVIHMVRLFAYQATSQLKEELGPEYKDLTMADLNPKTFVQKHLLADMQEDLADIKKELDGVKTELTGSVTNINSAGKDVRSVVNQSLTAPPPAVAAGGTVPSVEATAAAGSAPAALASARHVPWDPEAT